MSTTQLVLASASPARLALLRNAGFDPEVRVSGVDESGVDLSDVAAGALELARRKASAVASAYPVHDPAVATLVIGCDSLFEFDGVAHGKPASAEEATQRWQRMRNTEGRLHTGHCLIELPTGRSAEATATTVVHMGDPTDAEIAAYVATGEPLGVAGGATIDGYSAPFIDGIVGDPSNVVGLSLPLFRRLLGQLDIEIFSLWRPASAEPPTASQDDRPSTTGDLR